MGCLNGLEFLVGDHISKRRHTFAVLQPKQRNNHEQKKRKENRTELNECMNKYEKERKSTL